MDVKKSIYSLSVDTEKYFNICITDSAGHIHMFLYLIFMEHDNIVIYLFSGKDQAKVRWENFRRLNIYTWTYDISLYLFGLHLLFHYIYLFKYFLLQLLLFLEMFFFEVQVPINKTFL